MIISRGFGIVVVGVSFMVAVALIYTSKALGADEEFFRKQIWPIAVGLLINGLILATLGCLMNGKKIKELVEFDSRFIDDIFDGEHSLFFISVEYWGILSLLLSIALFGRQLVDWA